MEMNLSPSYFFKNQFTDRIHLDPVNQKSQYNMKKILALAILCFLLQPYTNAQKTVELKGSALFGNMQARHLGPAKMSGRVIDIEGHPEDGNILYVGSAGGGVWKTSDGGVTFNPIFDDYIQSIGCVAVDPVNPDNEIWVGTGEIWTRNSVSVGDGLYKSNDGGKSWDKIGFDKSERIAAIEIDPSNNKTVYVGILGALWGDSEERGIYKSNDGGATWEKILYIGPSTGCSDLVMDPNNPEVLYASMWDFRRTAWSFNSGGEMSALYKSTDAGKTWNKIHNGFPEGKLGRIAIAVAPSNSDILYSVIESEKNEDKGLYKSLDAGASWEQINNDFELAVRPFYFSRIVVSPNDENIITKAGLMGSLSKDGGKTFRPIGSGVHADIHDFHFVPGDKNKVYLGCDGGTYHSSDGGTVWAMSQGLPLSQYYHVEVDNEKPFNVYGGLQDNGSWVGPSSSSGGITSADWKRVGVGDGFRVYPHPENSNILYSEMQGADQIWRVNVARNQTKIVKPYPEEGDPKLRFNWNTPIATGLHNPDALFVGSQFLHKSDDMGETWRKISPDLTTNDKAKQNQVESGGLSTDNSGAENHCTIFTVGESPLDENVIWVGTDDGNVQVTTDGGANWRNVTRNINGLPSNTWVYHIEPSSHDVNTAYAVFDGHTRSDMNPYVFKTTDGGSSWTSITTDEVKGFSRSIQEDFVNPDLLYLGTEMGLFITINGGKSWSHFTNNMPPVAVHHVTLHERDHALVMGTHGRGVIVIDDVTPLRQLTPEVAAQKVHFFDREPKIQNEGSAFGDGAVMGEFVGMNPSSSAEIVYYLNKRHTFGKMKLEILDEYGKVLADLQPGKSKGINIVRWNYRYEMPKIATAKTFTFGGFTTPMVPPGEYKVRMTKGREVYESTIEVKADPESIHTPEDRMAGHEAAMRLYNMNEQLAYMVDQIDRMKEGSDMVLDKAPGKELTAKVRGFARKLEKLKDPLVVMTGDNYVGSAEPLLREKIAALYGNVAGYVGKPSNAQVKNMELLDSELQDAQTTLNELMPELEKLNKDLEKANMPKITFRSKEEFTKA